MNESILIKTVQKRIKFLKEDLMLWKTSHHQDKQTLQIIDDLRKQLEIIGNIHEGDSNESNKD